MKLQSLSLLTLLVLFSSFTFADESATDVANKIKALENELARAVVANDYKTLKRIEADSYVYTDSDAKVTTRDEFIKDYDSGKSRVFALKFDEMIVTTYGDSAVVRGVLTASRIDNGVDHSRVSRYTRFYVKFPDGWRAVAGHSSKLKDLPNKGQ
jgi:ketosteroid isomerase-like protein